MKRKFLGVLLTIILCFTAFSCVGGGQVSCDLVELTETRAVIVVEQTDDKATVLDCMQQLSDTLPFTMSGTMVTSINHKENAADFSACWMLYTSDIEMSNHEWGTIEYNGQILGSAILGAEALVVQAGEIYLWEYVSF